MTYTPPCPKCGAYDGHLSSCPNQLAKERRDAASTSSVMDYHGSSGMICPRCGRYKAVCPHN